MSEVNPTIQFINGSGTPRLIIVLGRPFGWIESHGEDDGTSLTVITKNAHALTIGITVRISGSGDGEIDGDFQVLSTPTSKTFTIHRPNAIGGEGGYFEALTDIYESTGTTAYTATGITETGSPAYASVQVGNRVSSFYVAGGLNYPTYAKVTAKATGILTVDGWNNGTPTNAQKFRIDGWIADMPRCQELTEVFDPDVLIHSLYRGDQGSRREPKMRGWIYTCILDYSRFLSADAIFDLKHQLAQHANNQLILIPRNDAPRFQYEVYYGDKVELSRYGKSPGYKKPIFVFKAKDNLASWPIVDGYGSYYATNYGTCL